MNATLQATATTTLARHRSGADRLNRRCLRALQARTPDAARIDWLMADHADRKRRLHEERMEAFARLEAELTEAYGHDRQDYGHDGGPEWYEPVLEDCYRFQD